MRAVEQTGCARVVLGGGVSANAALREAIAARLADAGVGNEGLREEGRVLFASPRLSIDNGAMVARAARFRFDRGDVAPLDTSASASLPFQGMVPAAS
jgi:N6-L-threonylcarbamoyladenine synthase